MESHSLQNILPPKLYGLAVAERVPKHAEWFRHDLVRKCNLQRSALGRSLTIRLFATRPSADWQRALAVTERAEIDQQVFPDICAVQTTSPRPLSAFVCPSRVRRLRRSLNCSSRAALA